MRRCIFEITKINYSFSEIQVSNNFMQLYLDVQSYGFQIQNIFLNQVIGKIQEIGQDSSFLKYGSTDPSHKISFIAYQKQVSHLEYHNQLDTYFNKDMKIKLNYKREKDYDLSMYQLFLKDSTLIEQQNFFKLINADQSNQQIYQIISLEIALFLLYKHFSKIMQLDFQ